MSAALEVIHSWITHRERHYMNVCTTHTILECVDNPHMAAIVNGAGMATPDGMPLVWVGRYYKQPVERVYGPDLMFALADQGVTHGYRHFFYGGAPGVVEKLVARLQERFPSIQIAGTYTPPYRDLSPEEEVQIIDQINSSRADIVWVGLGTPKQDQWVAKFRQTLEAPVLIPVGAAFDFHAGVKPQAPRWMQRSGTEWVFRLLSEPRRLGPRYLINNPRFVWLIAQQLLKRR